MKRLYRNARDMERMIEQQKLRALKDLFWRSWTVPPKLLAPNTGAFFISFFREKFFYPDQVKEVVCTDVVIVNPKEI
jgi:hypothetical protein